MQFHICCVIVKEHVLCTSELPKPSLGDLSDLKTLSVRHRRENNPNVLGYNYEELVALDTVDVELVPEKKGIILKHNEYHVSSKVKMNLRKLCKVHLFLANSQLLV